MAYATPADLASWVADVPPNAVLLLDKASRKLDVLLIGARYPVDTAGLPTDAGHIEALRDACCQQVEWWIDRGDSTGSGTGEWADVKIGDVSLSRSASPSGAAAPPPQVAAGAVATLLVAGLLPVRPYVYG